VGSFDSCREFAGFAGTRKKTNSSTGFPVELSLILPVSEGLRSAVVDFNVPTPVPLFAPARIAVLGPSAAVGAILARLRCVIERRHQSDTARMPAQAAQITPPCTGAVRTRVGSRDCGNRAGLNTAILAGANNGTGVGTVEVYDADRSPQIQEESTTAPLGNRWSCSFFPECLRSRRILDTNRKSPRNGWQRNRCKWS